ncbi:MAG: hypothetical protein P8J20_08900 [Novosphingobium sp.]|nr:hypothetical protein [Novosphingobium sp.]
MSGMRSSLDAGGLAGYAAAQLNAMFADGNSVEAAAFSGSAAKALSRLETCFAEVNSKYFFDGDRAVFDHLHGDQYAMWLYFLSNQLHCDGADPAIAKKLFLLNKALHGCDIFFEVELPQVFLLVHPLATVLGRGKYSDYFVAYQRCSVGSNHDIYPCFGSHVTMRPGSAVLGDCTIGNDCQIAAESLVLDRSLDAGTLYIGNPKTAVTRPNSSRYPLWHRS